MNDDRRSGSGGHRERGRVGLGPGCIGGGERLVAFAVVGDDDHVTLVAAHVGDAAVGGVVQGEDGPGTDELAVPAAMAVQEKHAASVHLSIVKEKRLVLAMSV
jgi:hypothetical protein